MNLFCISEGHLGEADRFGCLTLNHIKPGEDRLSIGQDIDTGAALNQCRPKEMQRIERREKFRRAKRSGAGGGCYVIDRRLHLARS